MTDIGELWLEADDGRTRLGCGEPLEQLPSDPAAIRQHARFDTHGRYRPLTGARNLRRGWWVEAGETLSPDEVVEAVYPLATVHRKQYPEGMLRVVTLDEVLARQSGRYESAASLPPAGRERVRRVLCRDWCVRTPVWASDERPPDTGIPCPEPCSVFVALAREAAQWDAAPPIPSAIDDTVEFADFEAPGNRIRETYLALLREDGP